MLLADLVPLLDGHELSRRVVRVIHQLPLVVLHFLSGLSKFILLRQTLLLDAAHGHLRHLTVLLESQKKLRVRLQLLLSLLVQLIRLIQLHLQVLAHLSEVLDPLARLEHLADLVELGRSGLLLG